MPLEEVPCSSPRPNSQRVRNTGCPLENYVLDVHRNRFLVGACTYFVLPVDLFVAQLVACAASFYAHVFFDKEYHIDGSRLQRFAWFRRKQELHFVHHRHASSNFAVIHFFWDRILGTYRSPDAGQIQANGTLRIGGPAKISAIRGGPV